MTLITGQFLDSGRSPLALGKFRVQLNAPLTDIGATPDAYLLPLPRDFQITAGVLETCDLQESATAGVSYTFTVLQQLVDYDFYLAGTGEFYGRNDDRPTHLHTGKYYSGVSHTPESLELERISRERLEAIGGAFQAIVPNQASVEFAELQRSGFSTDRMPQSARQIANLLLTDSVFMQNLVNLLVVQSYSPTQVYRRGNIVSSGGSAYQCLIENTIGVAPNTPNSPNWQLLVAKGDVGGTGGQDTPYNSSTWDGALWAPSANAIRDILETLAPKNSPTLTGVPTTSAPNLSDRSPRIASTEYVRANLDSRMAAAFTATGDPEAIASLSDLTRSNASLAQTSWVKGAINRYSRVVDSRASGTNGGSSINGVLTRTLNSIEVNSGDIVTLTNNTFTVRPGTYRLMAVAPTSGSVGAHRIFLWNVAAATRVLTALNTSSGLSIMTGRFTISANTDFQIRHVCSAAVANTGLGTPLSEAGVNEIFTIVDLWRLD